MNSNTLTVGSALQGGRYRMVKVMGQGGFGITYLAEQTGLGRKVAVKEFFMKDCCEREDASSRVTVPTAGNRELVEKFRKKFIREAQMIAGLDHGHIVKIYDVFEENGTAYYVMEYLGGGSLADEMKRNGAIPEQEAVEYIRQVADALDYLHSQNILHFDVKPSNVLLGKNGSAKLIDFGISKHYDESGSQTSSTPVGISKGFAPLEQYEQTDISRFTPATDIYALGATLYALLVGSNPPEASAILREGFPAKPSSISSILWSGIEQSMSFRPKDRPQSVKEFLGMLEPVSDRPASHGASAGESEETEITSPADSSFKTHPVLDTKSSAAHKSTSAQPKTQSKNLKSQPQKPNNTKLSAASKPAAPSSGKKRGWLKWFLIGLAAVVVLSLLARGCGNSSPEPDSVSELSDSIPAATNSSINGHEYVDLGLSVKWATCNVGASSPEDYGSYFAWGETSPKSDYDWSTLKYRTEGDRYDNAKFSKYVTDSKYGPVDNKSVLELSDDAARANWGGSWRMPTKAEFQELIDKCSWTWTTVNGKNGYKVVSKMNGNSIFLPAAGFRGYGGDYLSGVVSYGDYWSSSLYSDSPFRAASMSFDSGLVSTDYDGRCNGLSVRPVLE